MTARPPVARAWDTQAANCAGRRARALNRLGANLSGKLVDAFAVVTLLESVIEPGDRVCLEGNNQKQADFLASALTRVDPKIVHDLHMVQSVLALPEHLDVFESGIAISWTFRFQVRRRRALQHS